VTADARKHCNLSDYLDDIHRSPPGEELPSPCAQRRSGA
jgi:hypothetical protein